MPDPLSRTERALIDAHLRNVGATIVPRGVGAEVEPSVVWGRSAQMVRAQKSRDAAICGAAATLTLAQLCARFDTSPTGITRALRAGGVLAVDMAAGRG